MHWGRAVLGGFFAELAIAAIVFPVRYLFGQRAFLASIVIASAAMPFLFAIWVGRGIESRFILHGAIVGFIAVLLYVGLTRGGPEPLLYKIANGIKVVGGAAGGAIATGRRPGTDVVVQSS